MKFGLPWSVKDIRPEARETAQEAARRAGLSLDEWLNASILQRAAEQGVRSRLPARNRSEGPPDDYSRVQHRLDDLTRRIEQVAHTGSGTYARQPGRQQTDAFADMIGRLEYRLQEVSARLPESPANTAQLPPDLERAIAEFNARRRALSGEPAYAEREGVPVTGAPEIRQEPAPTQNLANLEEQLRRITDGIEALKRPDVEEAINALRTELGEIGRTLNDAMPRQAIETIEMQIQVLAQRIDEGQRSGVDRNSLAGVESGLNEVREILRALMPAENLVGYNASIGAIAAKLDLIVGEGDPATLQDLDRSLATLREMSMHVASNEAVSSLAAQVQTLTEKVDRIAIGSNSSEVLGSLQNRIDALTVAVSERTQIEAATPHRLESLMQTLSDKIGQMQESDGNRAAVMHLEDRIVELMERFDVTESRLDQLGAIERGLADLLVHMEALRTNKDLSALRADSPIVDSLRQEIAQTRGCVDSVDGRLGNLVDRLATIEKDLGVGRQPSSAGEANAPEPADAEGIDALDTDIGFPKISAAPSPVAAPQPSSPLSISAPPLDEALRATVASLTPAPSPSTGQIWPAPMPADNFTLANLPLEPGSGPPRVAGSPSARIAASEAALGDVRPQTVVSGNKSNFIAAARRAAQAAGQDPRGRPSRPDMSRTNAGGSPAPRGKAATRVKSLFLAASIMAIIVGSFHFAGNVFDFSVFDSKSTKVATEPEADPETSENSIPPAETETVAGLPGDQPPAANPAEPTAAPAATVDSDITASLLAPPVMPSLTPASPPSVGVIPPNPPAPVLNQAPQGGAALLDPPALNLTKPKPKASGPSEVTGSIARAPSGATPKRSTEFQPQPPAPDRLPVGIGGPQLRSAALAGDAGAAYEIALRFVEARGVSANLEEAARWFERAASKGLAPAQFRYASMLEKGQGVKKDLTAAQKLYIAAAGKGHAKAMHNLAVLYAEGIDGNPDYTNAAQWFRKAAELGVADSQYNLGVLAARGLGTERNIAEAYKWFALAAAQGDRDAGRKRDEVAAHLDAQALAAAQQAVKNFTPAVQPPAAITVPAPIGGWDRATPSSEKPRAAAGPLSISAFNSGKP
jgi:localization factor PodJL